MAWSLTIPDALVSVMETIEPRVHWRRPSAARRQQTAATIATGRRPRLALTVDDAPYLGWKAGPRLNGESYLAEILDVLALHEAKATFMVTPWAPCLVMVGTSKTGRNFGPDTFWKPTAMTDRHNGARYQ